MIWDIFQDHFVSNGLAPHGQCLLWVPSLLVLHAGSDLLTAAAYFSIPVAMAYFVMQRRDLQFRFVFLLFAAFIFACGTTHLMSAWTIWHPDYWLQGWIKFITALVSMSTSIVQWWLIPKALALPSPQDLENVNRRLRNEIQERLSAEEAIVRLNTTLEQRVTQRTQELLSEIEVRRRAEEQLRQAAIVFESTHDGIVITDAEEHIINVNQAFSDLTGYRLEEAIGQTPRILKSGRHQQDFYEAMWRSLATEGGWQGEIWNRRKSGEVYPELMTINVVKDASGAVTNYVAVFSDISHLKETEAKLEFLANHDPLTELPNRRLLEQRLDHAMRTAARHSRPLALLLIDLDRFKDINDSFGHPVGDLLLQEIAVRFKKRLRNSDTLARLGGDEFAVLLEDLENTHSAGRVSQDLLDSLAMPIRVGHGTEIVVGASIGISQFPNDGQHGVDLIQNADAALYQAKADGRRVFRFYTPSLTRAAQERISMEARLRHALEHENLDVYYQPQWDIHEGRITGVEALARWSVSDDERIPPSRFIPIAEETGLITELGEYVLRTACRQAKAWLKAGLPPIRLAVNVSVRQFVCTDLAERIVAILRETAFEPHWLEVELTESALITDANDVPWLLEKIRATGMRIAIDDFGTGYSSLAYLKRFPVNTIKIDREFVKDIPYHQDDMKIITTIIHMAHVLGFAVLAEGVETREQFEFLTEQQCDSCQGYYFSKPLPADALASLLLETQGGTSRADD